MSVTAAQVKELRERTGAGMMECKKALVEVNGDIDAAIEAMRKSGQAQADKKAGRIAAEGMVYNLISDDGKTAVILEVNCETDFVARDENFNNFVKKIAVAALANKIKDVEALAKTELEAGKTVDEERASLISKIGENVKIRRLQIISTDGAIGHYIHGGRIGVLVNLKGNDLDLAKDLAMHVAANSPLVVSPDEVPAELLEKEKEIFMAQAENSGKPAEIIEKMVQGRIRKFLDEVSLEGQAFVKDPNTKVSNLLKDKNASVVEFVRYEVGEGIEKEEVNFAEEVMAQVKG
jgi:elongation factor Ts